ncbi:MAG: hypothetical protein Ta2A_23350 [Treponemataceae bacterium]|nr:MAG: hypothetical protein Ta2A_23350 [Treponemataceae bacterium]
MLGVTDFAIKDGYTVYVEFNDGQKGLVDLKETLEKDHREIIRELLDLEKFRAVKIEFHTLSWDNGVDFAPEFLYEQIKIQGKVA